jgi:AraC family transcriptional regulator
MGTVGTGLAHPKNSPPDFCALRVALRSDGPGSIEVAGRPDINIAIHAGRPVYRACTRAGQSHAATVREGDIDIIPPRVKSVWELMARDQIVLLSLAPETVQSAAEAVGLSQRVAIRDRFQIRDPRIEHIAWALRTELQQGFPSGRLFLEGMAISLSAHLIGHHASERREFSAAEPGLPPKVFRQLRDLIEDRLSESLSLNSLAGVVNYSPSHLRALFRKSAGMPLHQYVIHRRVSRAVTLLSEEKLSVLDVAIAVGFAHTSHLAFHMRRLLGAGPSDYRRR